MKGREKRHCGERRDTRRPDRAEEATRGAPHWGNPNTTILLATDPPGQIGERIPTATPMRCLPSAR
jgi:hypothetical protein